MTRSIIFITSLLFSIIASAQIKEQRNISDFSKITVSNGIKVFYTESEKTSLIVETDDQERLNFVKTEVSGNTLKLYVNARNTLFSKKSNRKNNKKEVNFTILNVYLTGPKLSDFDLNSSGNVVITNTLKTDRVKISCSSSGSLKGKIEADEMDINLSSASTVNLDIKTRILNIKQHSSSLSNLSGETDVFTLEASSASTCSASSLISKEVSVKASSAANVKIHATSSLNIEASSAANVTYSGTAKNNIIESSSGANISKK